MIQGPSRAPQQNRPLSIRDFKGMDVTGTRDLRRSPDMLNCVLDDEGTPEMRTGYEKWFPVSLGEGPILGIHTWLPTSGDEHHIIHHADKLYKVVTPGAQPTLLYTGVNSLRHSVGFTMGTKLCIIDGLSFLIYNGTTVVTAESTAYIPLRFIGTPPGGGGTVVEDFNLLQPRWRQRFSTVAGTMAYTIFGAPLDALEKVTLNGVVKTITTDYTVNLTTGVLTLTANPGVGTNNLEVQPRKAAMADASRINKCTVAHVYGGPSDSKIFLTGNPDYPHIDWWTGLPMTGAYDPTYWPDTNYDRIGGDNEAVVGYEVQYDKMVVFKEKSIYLRTWELQTDAYGRTVMRFPSQILTAGEGCAEFDSICMIENNPFFLTKTGVYALFGSQVRDERNVEKMSTLVNIEHSGHGAAIDFKDKYYLALGDGVVWVCDYKRQVKDEASGKYVPVWYPWDGLHVNVWHGHGDNLLFGSSQLGMVYKMKTKDADFPYNDDGAVINSHFDSIFSTFDRDDQTKLVQSTIIGMKVWSRDQINVGYATEDGDSGVIHVERRVLFDWANIDFSDFSFDTSRRPRAFKVRIDDARNIQEFSVRLSSSGVVNEFFGISSIDINYQLLSEVR